MSNTALLWIVTLLYIGQAGVSLWHGQPAAAVIVGGYVIANLGLIWALAP